MDAKIIARIMDGSSCAELETVINEAGLCAGYERAETITMDHFIEACMRTVFHVPARVKETDEEEIDVSLSDFENVDSQIIYHEAGHAVVSEILCPDSVTLISAYKRGGGRGGFTDYYNDRSRTPLYWMKSRIVSSLSGIAAIEQRYGIVDMGGEHDIDHAFEVTKELLTNMCINGFHLHTSGYDDTERLKAEQEKAICEEVERFYQKAIEIIAQNREFLDKVAVALAEKKLLTAKDVQRIKSECKIYQVAI